MLDEPEDTTGHWSVTEPRTTSDPLFHAFETAVMHSYLILHQKIGHDVTNMIHEDSAIGLCIHAIRQHILLLF